MRAQCLLMALAAAALAQSDDSTSPVEPCAAAAASQAASLQANPPSTPGDIIYASIDAETAWNCVQSVSFDQDNALIILKAIRQFMSLHTNIAYLKNPPKAYQQPALDVMGRLDDMTTKVNSNGYATQWDFDYDLYSIEIAAHDEHFNAATGTFQVFQWQLPYRLTTISADGKALPQVYVYEDIRDQAPNRSPVVQIEGKSVFEYLQDYNTKAAAAGLSDPHAEWNVLMWNEGYQFGAAGAHSAGMSYSSNNLEGSYVYNGPSLKGRFANGSTFEWVYTAGANHDLTLSKISDGKSFFDNLIANPKVLPATPTAVDPAAISTAFETPTSTSTVYYAPTTTTTREALTAVPMMNYPDPDVIQDDFGLGGTASGYLLQDASIGVLSLPTFEAGGDSASFISFSDVVGTFIQKAQGMKKIVIDIRGNTGGSVFLGFDTFQQFFPTVEPTIMFRTRATDTVNTLGKLFTGASDNSGGLLPPSAQEGVLSGYGVKVFINAALSLTPDDQDWPGWSDFYGPNNIHGDQFTNNGKWNLSSDRVAVDNGGTDVAGYGNRTLDYAQPWDAQDIIVLSDGVCGSTCSIFAELMKTDGGVRFVAVGGIPENGPMQAVAGTRGMNVIDWGFMGKLGQGFKEALVLVSPSVLAPILKQYGIINADDIFGLPPALETLPWFINGRFNTLDEVRAASPQDPLQFTYEAADCRMFYTGDMIRDVTVTWKQAAKALDSGDDICVKGSRNGKGVKINDTVTNDPGVSYDKDWKAANTTDSPSAASSSAGSSRAFLGFFVALVTAMVCL